MRPRFAFLLLLTGTLFAQSEAGLPTVSAGSFAGIYAAQVHSTDFTVDPSGAVGTKQFLEYVNTYYQAYSKTSPYTPVWSTPQSITTPFAAYPNCSTITGDGEILFDHLASRWVIGAHTSVPNQYYYCVAVSNTDDLSSPALAWYAYEISLNSILGQNSHGDYYFPDWPKLGTWADAYYLTIDLNDVDNSYLEVGTVVCALDRTNMLTGATPRTQQCFKNPTKVTGSLYLSHSLIPADIDGTTAPPSGREEYLASIQNPPNNGQTITSGQFNLWAFHVDWNVPANSTFTRSMIADAQYIPGCYDLVVVAQTFCVPEPSSATTNNYVDSVGDRFMPRFAYRNFGTYESFLVSHTIQVSKTSEQTAVRWYELRGSGTPTLYQDGNINPDSTTYRFVPSIAQDHDGNAMIGYSVSSSTLHPGIRISSWNLQNATEPIEQSILNGVADDENNDRWGSYTSMTVDPVNDCTFWYTNEYFPKNQTGTSISWYTRIAHMTVSTCK
ncbi:MAG TPA: hypothetical protein VND65_22810 [Candidatus Binatia bacterium]|nr:hypothetical protein [Candidatus Binatia bacterium]